MPREEGQASDASALRLLPGALVHAGEARFERVDADGLPLKSGQQFPVVGIELLQQARWLACERSRLASISA